MLSDSCHQCVDDLLDVVTRYSYCDNYKAQLIFIISKLNEIRDDLDHNCEGCKLKNNQITSMNIAKKMFEDAQEKR